MEERGERRGTDLPTDEAVAWFDQDAQAYLARNPTPSEHLDDLLRLVPQGGRILDVGCGPGVDAHHVTQRGYHVTGVDAAPGMIALAQRTFPGVDFRIADMRRLPFPPASFDGVLALFSIIFLRKRDVPAVLRTFGGLLRDRGAILLAVQGGTPAEPGEPNRFSVMAAQEIVDFAREAGFEIVGRWDRAAHPHERPFRKIHVLARKAPA